MVNKYIEAARGIVDRCVSEFGDNCDYYPALVGAITVYVRDKYLNSIEKVKYIEACINAFEERFKSI